MNKKEKLLTTLGIITFLVIIFLLMLWDDGYFNNTILDSIFKIGLPTILIIYVILVLVFSKK